MREIQILRKQAEAMAIEKFLDKTREELKLKMGSRANEGLEAYISTKQIKYKIVEVIEVKDNSQLVEELFGI